MDNLVEDGRPSGQEKIPELPVPPPGIGWTDPSKKIWLFEWWLILGRKVKKKIQEKHFNKFVRTVLCEPTPNWSEIHQKLIDFRYDQQGRNSWGWGANLLVYLFSFGKIEIHTARQGNPSVRYSMKPIGKVEFYIPRDEQMTPEIVPRVLYRMKATDPNNFAPSARYKDKCCTCTSLHHARKAKRSTRTRRALRSLV